MERKTDLFRSVFIGKLPGPEGMIPVPGLYLYFVLLMMCNPD